MAFRTQKISQMTPKGADLEATDLIEVSTIESGSYVTRSITGQELIDAIPAPTGFVPTSRTLTINGTTQDLSANRTFTIPTDLTVGTTPISSGTIGRVLFQGTGNVLQQSSSLAYDDTLKTFTLIGPIGSVFQHTPLTNYVGFGGVQLNVANGTERAFAKLNPDSGEFKIGTTGSGYFTTIHSGGVERLRIPTTGNVLINTTTDAGFRLDVNGTARVQDLLDVAGTNGRLIFRNPELSTRLNGVHWTNPTNTGSYGYIALSSGTGEMRMFTSATYFPTFYSSGSERMRIPTTGNVLINTTTDAGFRLDVNGTARVTGTGTTSATTALRIQNSAATNRLLVRDDGSVFIGNEITGTGTDVLNQQPQRFYTLGGSQFSSYIGTTFNGGTGDTSLALFGVGTGGGYSGSVRFFTSNNSATPLLAMIVDRNQSVAIGLTNSTNLTADASARLQVDSTTRGFLPPRQTQAQRTAIASPAVGLIVYQTDLAEGLYIYKSTGWTFVI